MALPRLRRGAKSSGPPPPPTQPLGRRCRRESHYALRGLSPSQTYSSPNTMVQITGAVARTKTEVQSRGQKRCHEELTYRKFNLPRCHCSRPPVRIEQRFPKPRVGSSTLPRPTNLIYSFSRSSTIPSIRRNAPKGCKCHKSVILFCSRRGQMDQNEPRPAIPRAEQHLKFRPPIQARSNGELPRSLPGT